jgi:hypothetical protein
MNVISYWPRNRHERLAHTAQFWRRCICWFPAIGMSAISMMWFVYLMHLTDALPEKLDEIFCACSYLLGANLGPRSDSLFHAISLAPFALGMPFIFIVQAIRRQQAEKMRASWTRN